MAERETPRRKDVFPSWEIVNLVASYLDGKSLAVASCVSKSWSLAMSSDFVWRRAYADDFPSLYASVGIVGVDDDTLVFHRRLYGMSYTSAQKGTRKLVPPKPRLSLGDMVFVISLVFKGNTIEVVKRGDEIAHDPDGVFMFDISLQESAAFGLEDDEHVKVTWDLVLKGWKQMFRMMDLEGKAKSSFGSEGYLSEDLPPVGCCSSNSSSSGIVADLKLKYSGRSNEEVVVDKLCVGMMSTLSWRYLTVDDGLRYLQQFLLRP